MTNLFDKIDRANNKIMIEKNFSKMRNPFSTDHGKSSAY